jgi:hypothetical protein
MSDLGGFSRCPPLSDALWGYTALCDHMSDMTRFLCFRPKCSKSRYMTCLPVSGAFRHVCPLLSPYVRFIRTYPLKPGHSLPHPPMWCEDPKSYISDMPDWLRNVQFLRTSYSYSPYVGHTGKCPICPGALGGLGGFLRFSLYVASVRQVRFRLLGRVNQDLAGLAPSGRFAGV